MTNLTNYHSHCLYCDGRANMEDFIRFAISEGFSSYGISSYPTTFMIDRDGNVFGYAAGQLSMEMMESIIRQTVTGVREQPGQ